MIREKGRGPSLGLMVDNIEEIGEVENNMGLESTLAKMDKRRKENGVMVRRSNGSSDLDMM